MMVTHISWKEEECGERNENCARSLKIGLSVKYSGTHLVTYETHVDDKGPSPPCTTFCAMESRGEGALSGTGQHSTSRLGDVVKAHAQTDFMR